MFFLLLFLPAFVTAGPIDTLLGKKDVELQALRVSMDELNARFMTGGTWAFVSHISYLKGIDPKPAFAMRQSNEPLPGNELRCILQEVAEIKKIDLDLFTRDPAARGRDFRIGIISAGTFADDEKNKFGDLWQKAISETEYHRIDPVLNKDGQFVYINLAIKMGKNQSCKVHSAEEIVAVLEKIEAAAQEKMERKRKEDESRHDLDGLGKSPPAN